MSTLAAALLSVLILPCDPDEISRLAAARRRKGDYQAASNLYQMMARRVEQTSGAETRASLAAWHNVAVSLVETGEPARAIPLLRRILRDAGRLTQPDPSLVRAAKITLTLAYLRDDMFAEAKSLLGELAATQPDQYDIVIAIVRAEWMLRQREFKEARTILNDCLREHAPRDEIRLVALQLAAVAEFTTGDFRMSMTRFREALMLGEELWGAGSESLIVLLEAQKQVAGKLKRRQECREIAARIKSLRGGKSRR